MKILRMSFERMKQSTDVNYELVSSAHHLQEQQRNMNIYLKDSGQFGYFFTDKTHNLVSGEIDTDFPDDGKTHSENYIKNYYTPTYQEKILQQISLQGHDIKLITNVVYKSSQEINIEKKHNEVYLTKLGNKELGFKLTAIDGQNVEGTITLDKDIEGDLDFINLKLRTKILQKLKDQGYSLLSKPGLNYNEWKIQSTKRLYDGMEMCDGTGLHYARLTYILKQLGIEFPPIEIPDEATLLN